MPNIFSEISDTSDLNNKLEIGIERSAVILANLPSKKLFKYFFEESSFFVKAVTKS